MRIRVVSFQGQPLPQAISHDFDDLGGTIGRAETNQLALPDPQRHISRLQARVVCRNGQYEIINQGANPINVNGHVIGNGSSMPIASGARVEIGGYLMEAIAPTPAAAHPAQDVTMAPEAFSPPPRPAPAPIAAPAPLAAVPHAPIAQPQSMPPLRAPAAPLVQPAPPPAAPPRASGPVDDPLGMFGAAPAPAAGRDSLADILNGVTAASPLPTPEALARPADDPLGGWTPTPYTPPPSESLVDLLSQPAASSQAMPSIRPGMIPDDFDPFADPMKPLPEDKEANPFDDMESALGQKPAGGSSIDTMYQLPPSSQPDTRDPFLGSSLGEPLPDRGFDAPLDPLAAFSGEQALPPGYQTMPDQVPELYGTFVPPRVEPFAAPAPGAFAAPAPARAAQAAEKEVFLSWQDGPPGPGGLGAALPPAPAAKPADDPLLSMFDSARPPGAAAPGSDVLGLGVAPAMPGDDLLAGLGAPPARPEPPPPPVQPARAAPAQADSGSLPTLSGDALFAGIGNIQSPEPMIARAFAEPAVAPAPPRPQAPASAPPPPARPVAVAERAAPAPAIDALTRAFLAGLGAPNLPLPEGMTPEVMERVGRLLREATQGTLDLLLARATTKREVRADVTMIVSTDNNPLKFSPDVIAALTHLLVPQGPGFLTPVAAMRDAYDDLRSHQFGFMAGLRAALAGVLKRFDPAVLEQRMAQKSMLDSVLPMNRRAKLWDLYIALYRDIAVEAEDDFHTLFGREFLRAYQEQVERLGQGKP
ncbi:MAG: type VI secretion system-associated FHA domain protein TagH [Sterolibacteriaceae bacterium]|nr:type VI secretion system-associated FHA domain protein TagH [Candidatus Methylophosphatis haderslevensis]